MNPQWNTRAKKKYMYMIWQKVFLQKRKYSQKRKEEVFLHHVTFFTSW